MSTIVEFLLARIAEDEEDARAADGTRWNHEDKVVTFEFWDHEHGDYDWDVLMSTDTRGNGWHIVRWSPARALAECQAKRAIIAPHVPSESDHPSPSGKRCDACSDTRHDEWWYSETPWPCPTLRHLAAVYADHPDYLAEWRLPLRSDSDSPRGA